LTKSRALQKEVWDLIDPDTPTATAIIEAEPTLPMPSDVAPDKTFAQLTAAEREELTILRDDYRRCLKKHDRRRQGLLDMRVAIQESISKEALEETVRSDSVKAMLVLLQKRYAPTVEAREKEVQDAYLLLREKKPISMAIEPWLDSWKKTVRRAQRLELPDVYGVRAQKDFLRILEDLSYEAWAVIQRDRLETALIPMTFDDLVESFRRYFQDRTKTGKRQAGGFATGALTERDCLCGQKHTFKECRYFNQPEGWTPESKIEASIVEKLARFEPIRDVVRRKTDQGVLAPTEAIKAALGDDFPRLVA